MKLFGIIILTMLFCSCEMTESITKVCETEYNYTWYTESNPVIDIVCDLGGCHEIAVMVNNNRFSNFTINSDTITLTATNIMNGCSVELCIIVTFVN